MNPGMDYVVLSQETEEKVKEISRRIHRLQNWGSIASLRHLGVNAHGQVGAGYLSLKTLAADYTPDESLAEALWMTRKREEQMMACFLFPQSINKEKITQLMSSCISTEIAEYVGSLCVSEHHELKNILKTWSESSVPFLQIAALCAGARHLVVHKTDALISTDLFQEMTHKAYQDKYVRLVAARYRL